MPSARADDVQHAIDDIYRNESRRVFATLIRVLGDFDLAEEALHDAFIAAVEQWSRDGIPDNPRAWLVSTGRFKAIDAIRRRKRFDSSMADIADRLNHHASDEVPANDGALEDDRLRLIFTCCHPAIAPEAQVALTLREVCGLRTEEIASAFLTSPSTIAQRIVRGKAKIRDASIPYQEPAVEDLPDRLDTVLAVIYLVFNEGYSASSGDAVTRSDLTAEAIRLARLLVELLPDPEAQGLLALMLLQESRRLARSTLEGDLILLEDQDRNLWNRELIAEGRSIVERSLASERVGTYAIQAAIAAVHADARTAPETDWAQVVALYTLLMRIEPSAIVELNRAVAVAMRDGPQEGIDLIDGILSRGSLNDYHLAHAARADLLRRLNHVDDAREAYRRALKLAKQEPERRFLERRLRELG